MDILKEIIFPVLDEYKEEEDLEFENSEELELFGGDNSIFDSLSLVRFLVEIQNQILDITDKEVALASPKAMSRANSPFKTVKSLEEYIKELLSAE